MFCVVWARHGFCGFPGCGCAMHPLGQFWFVLITVRGGLGCIWVCGFSEFGCCDVSCNDCCFAWWVCGFILFDFLAISCVPLVCVGWYNIPFWVVFWVLRFGLVACRIAGFLYFLFL